MILVLRCFCVFINSNDDKDDKVDKGFFSSTNLISEWFIRITFFDLL